MALSIVADEVARPGPVPGIERDSRWSCDIYVGARKALIAAGVITAKQLKPQRGRPPGRTAFLPNGQPCPSRVRAWMQPGYLATWKLDDGTYRVEVTVGKEEQARRRAAQKAAAHEEREALVTRKLEQLGPQLKDWKLRQTFDGCAETWEGTKAQMQAAGLGVGLAFPGEPGAPKRLTCRCPLSFQFRVSLSHDDGKAAAGIFIAHSWYVGGPLARRERQYTSYAPGVQQEVWTPAEWGRCDVFVGTVASLVGAGLVPSPQYFPGAPGTNRLQASYRQGWAPATNANYPRDAWTATIRKKGAGQFVLEVSVSEAERMSREQLHRRWADEQDARERVLAAERKKLRHPPEPEPVLSEVEFRKEAVGSGMASLRGLWREFTGSYRGWRFDIEKGTDEYADLCEAFQTIEDLLRTAPVTRDDTDAKALAQRLKVAAARNDKGLQCVLRAASHLRLVRGASDEQSGTP